jgi:hypothetical protein
LAEGGQLSLGGSAPVFKRPDSGTDTGPWPPPE